MILGLPTETGWIMFQAVLCDYGDKFKGGGSTRIRFGIMPHDGGGVAMLFAAKSTHVEMYSEFGAPKEACHSIAEKFREIANLIDPEIERFSDQEIREATSKLLKSGIPCEEVKELTPKQAEILAEDFDVKGGTGYECKICGDNAYFVNLHYCASCYCKIVKANQDESRTVVPKPCECGFPDPAITHDGTHCFVSCHCGKRGHSVELATFPGDQNDAEALAIVQWNCEMKKGEKHE